MDQGILATDSVKGKDFTAPKEIATSSPMCNDGYAKLPSIVTTMLGQAKTIIQAEIDSARELINIFRFNCVFAKELQDYQPISKDPAAHYRNLLPSNYK